MEQENRFNLPLIFGKNKKKIDVLKNFVSMRLRFVVNGSYIKIISLFFQFMQNK